MVPISGGTVLVGEAVSAQAWHAPRSEVRLGDYCIDRFEYPNRAGARPEGNHTWSEAAALCADLGKRLCAAAEWEHACRGPEGRDFVYGWVFEPKTCFTPAGDGPVVVNWAGSARSGSHPGCVSPEGVYDLNGSLSEWVSDPWQGRSDHTRGEVDPLSWRTVRGGTMWWAAYGQDCTSRHGHHMDGRRYEDDGFRCCAEPLGL